MPPETKLSKNPYRFIELREKIKKASKSVISDIQWAKISSKLHPIRTLLDPEERKYLNCKGFYEYYEKPKEVKAKVVILGLRTFPIHNLAVFDKVMSDFLRNNGAEVKNVICDSVLEACDMGEVGSKPQEVFCYICKNERKRFFKLYKNDYLLYGDFITQEEKENIKNRISQMSDEDVLKFTYLGVKVHQHALDSTVRHFKKAGFEKDNPEYMRLFKKHITQAVISTTVAKNIVEKEKPTHLVSLHGCYSGWGPFCEYFMNQGIHVRLYVKAVHKIGCFLFPTHGGVNLNFSHDENTALWNMFKDTILAEGQKKESRDLMALKKKGQSLEYKLYNKGKDASYINSKIEEILNSKDKKKYVLYPNLVWDVGVDVAGSKAFKDVFEWIYQTVDFFIKNPNYYLIVKPHPTEASLDYTETGVNEIIVERFGSLPDNILLLPKEYPVSSYELMDKGCIGITYNGTVGVEHSYFKKPVLVAGIALYTEPGVTLKVNSNKEYFDLIENPQPLYDFPIYNYELIEKYTYFYHFGLLIPIPFFRSDVWCGHCLNWDVLYDYENFIKTNKIMNKVAKTILDKKPVLNTT